MTARFDFVLTRQREPFRRIVLQHVADVLGLEEWRRLRAFACNRSRYVDRSNAPALEAAPAELLDVALSEDGMSIAEVLKHCEGSPIAELDGQPVYYVQGRGIYMWGESLDARPILSFWATHPAYPPGW